MAQDTGDACHQTNVFRFREQQLREDHREDGFANVVKGNQNSGAPAEQGGGVGGTQIAGAVAAGIHLLKL